MSLVFLSLLALSCQSNGVKPNAVPSPTNYHGWGFDVSLPNDCKLEKETKSDFDTYTITKGNHVLVFIYAGYHPSFPKSVPKTVKIRQTRINGKFAQFARWEESNKHSEHVLIRIQSFEKIMRTKDKRPAFLHCIYGMLNAEDTEIADSIIRSIQATETE